MSDRLKSMERVVAVQAQVKRMAEWKLAAIEQRKAALVTAQRELASFLDDGAFMGPFATVALKQSDRIAQREAVAEHDRQRQAALTQKAQASHKLAEQMTDAVAKDERAAEERRALESLIEAHLARTAPPD